MSARVFYAPLAAACGGREMHLPNTHSHPLALIDVLKWRIFAMVQLGGVERVERQLRGHLVQAWLLSFL